jgi:hypothetical protein
MTTKIYEGTGLNASAEHLILFDDGLVFDLPQIQSRFVTVYDRSEKRVTLLDRQSQVQTRIGTDDLVNAMAQARADAKTPQLKERIGLNATVQPSTRVIGWAIRFAEFEYHAATQTPEDESVATEYGLFADLASRLNLVRRLGPPPFGRMTLNRHIAGAKELPLETTLTVHRGEQTDEYRSTHTLEELTDDDKEKIKEVRGMLALYKEVGLSDFPTGL